MDGALQLNLSALNKCESPIIKIVNRASLNENADATIEGFEAEFTMFLSPTLMIDGFFAHTDATVDDFASVDSLNPNATTKAPLPAGATGFYQLWVLQHMSLVLWDKLRQLLHVHLAMHNH